MNIDSESQIWDLDKICLEKCEVKMENIGVCQMLLNFTHEASKQGTITFDYS